MIVAKMKLQVAGSYTEDDDDVDDDGLIVAVLHGNDHDI